MKRSKIVLLVNLVKYFKILLEKYDSKVWSWCLKYNNSLLRLAQELFRVVIKAYFKRWIYIVIMLLFQKGLWLKKGLMKFYFLKTLFVTTKCHLWNITALFFNKDEQSLWYYVWKSPLECLDSYSITCALKSRKMKKIFNRKKALISVCS